MPIEEWLLLRRVIDPETGCWEWQGGKIAEGYGHVRRPLGGPVLVHRLAYEIWVAPVPEGFLVLHSCDNPPCFNPEHLFLGDHAANARDMVAKGRNFVSPNFVRQRPRRTEQILRGEAHGRSKLTAEIVLAIRADSRPQRVIAAAYGLSNAHVARIKSRQAWAHV